MTDFQVTPGRPGWIAVETAEICAAIGVTDDHQERYAVAAQSGLVSLLDALAAQGLAAMPDFAIAERGGPTLRVLLRGSGVARWAGVEVHAQGRAPWRELDLSEPGQSAEAERSERVELGAGSVPGWRRPSRFDAAAKAVDTPQIGDAPQIVDAVESPASTRSSLPWRRPAPVRTTSASAPGTAPGTSPAEPAPHTSSSASPALASIDELAPTSDGPQVLAVRCPADHLSPPNLPSCRICGAPIPQQEPQESPRPTLGVLVISTGGVVPLDRGVLLGRTPSIDHTVPPLDRPHLVRLAGIDNDISRNHAEVRLQDWRVLVRDLGSTNGTAIIEPGGRRFRLPPHTDHPIEPGTTIELADRVSMTYAMAE